MGGPNSRSMGDTIGDRAPVRALKELKFVPLERAPASVRDLYFAIVGFWHEHYLTFSGIFFGLMAVTWISTGIGLLARLRLSPKLRRWSRIWLSEPVVNSSLGMSILFFANVGITALLVDPQFRYDFSLLPFKIMLSGIGACVLLRLLTRLEVRTSFRFAHEAQWPHRLLARMAAAVEALPESALPRGAHERWRGLLPMSVAYAALLAVGFGLWMWQVDRFALRVPAEGTIHVQNAYCRDFDNVAVLPTVRSACSGERQCTFAFDPRDFHNEICGDRFQIEWTCSKDGPRRHASSPPEPKPGTKIRLSCE